MSAHSCGGGFNIKVSAGRCHLSVGGVFDDRAAFRLLVHAQLCFSDLVSNLLRGVGLVALVIGLFALVDLLLAHHLVVRFPGAGGVYGLRGLSQRPVVWLDGPDRV